jgi:hypothetical protein
MGAIYCAMSQAKNMNTIARYAMAACCVCGLRLALLNPAQLRVSTVSRPTSHDRSQVTISVVVNNGNSMRLDKLMIAWRVSEVWSLRTRLYRLVRVINTR